MSLFIPRDHVRIEFAVLRTITAAVKLLDEQRLHHPDDEHNPITVSFLNSDESISTLECDVVGDGYVESATNRNDISGVFLDVVLRSNAGWTSEASRMKTSDPYDQFETTFDVFDTPRGVYLEKYDIPILPEEVAYEFQEELIEGRIVSSIITDTGRQIEVPHDFWRTKLSAEVLKGNSQCRFEHDGKTVQGYAFVEKNAFSFINEERQEDTLASDINDDLYDPEFSKSIRYLPPYVYFMADATRRLGLKSTERRTKDEIETWLRSNWPTAMLGEPSEDKIRFMATFLRHPSDAIGGHFKKVRPALSPSYRWITGYYPPKEDPLVTYQRKLEELDTLRAANYELEQRRAEKP